jgi:hypothetical protein
MVSISILTLAILGVATLFNISSDAAGRTAAHAEMLGASMALQNALTDEVGKIVPGLLIIESPPPTAALADFPGGERIFRLRHDRLVFLASHGTDGLFESFTDPTRGVPDAPPATPSWESRPAAGAEALTYFGPGIPVVGDGTANGERREFEGGSADPTLTAAEWIFCHRAIILLMSDPGVAGWSPPDVNAFIGGGGMMNGGPLAVEFVEGRMDAVAPSAANPTAINAALLIGFLDALPAAQILTSLADIRGMWDPNLAPTTVSYTDPAAVDYYTKSGFNFIPRLFDFRIEWTDGGRVDPLGPDLNQNTGDEDFRTRWFGLRPYQADAFDPFSPNSMRYQARMRALSDPDNPANPRAVNPDNQIDETIAYRDRIEWSPTGVAPDADARYRAVWRGDDYHNYKPVALRFTYRIIDGNLRLRESVAIDQNEDALDDTDSAGVPYSVARASREFSLVLALD